MPWPRTGSFGLIDNPLTDSPYIADSGPGEGGPNPPINTFLLLSGFPFLLLNGNMFELLGAV